MSSGDFAAIAVALYAAHHVGDYWVQWHEDALHKADPGLSGRLHCLNHVLTYVATQTLMLIPLVWMVHFSTVGVLAGVAVSGVTHYIADRRTPLVRLAGLIPGKSNFLRLGALRPGQNDNPSLTTGAWALDQSWHIFWGVFVAALLMVIL